MGEFSKGEDGRTKLKCSPGCKCIKCAPLRFTRGDVADINKAPTSRIYTRDYTKVGRDAEDVDLVSAALGKPAFRL
jgi:hypothetical protein